MYKHVEGGRKKGRKVGAINVHVQAKAITCKKSCVSHLLHKITHT